MRLAVLATTASVLIFASFGLAKPANADVKIDTWRGHKVLRLTGSIDDQTAEQFATLATAAPPLPHGLPVLLLDSPGGSVEAAIKISHTMDRMNFHTVIPNGARCASACGSIVFIAGTYRTVEPFGALGQHSCSLAGEADQECNDLISEHAFENGVSYGSIAAFVTYVPPKDILWFSRADSDGWGLTRYPGERESRFQKSEPRVLEMLTGQTPPAQAAWRLDFREDGFKAFLRPASDYEREMQINLFCNESLSGRLFLAMEVTGPASAVVDAVLGLRVNTDRFTWDDTAPIIWQADQEVTEVITEVPKDRIVDFLTTVGDLTFAVVLRKLYQPMVATTSLETSGEVLRFAANHCTSGVASGAKPPLR